MDKQRTLHFFTRSEKSLFGTCSKLSKKLNVSTLTIRIALIVLTLLFIPFGIIVYAGLYLILNQNTNKMVTFGLFGALMGIPLSYYFQSNIIKSYGGNSGVFGYLRNFTQTVERYDKFVGNAGDIIFNVILSVVIFAIVGGTIGYYISKKEAK